LIGIVNINGGIMGITVSVSPSGNVTEPSEKQIWYTGDNGLIPADSVLEVIDTPSISQNYKGGDLPVGTPWTLAIHTDADVPNFSNHFLLNVGSSGGFAIGYGSNNQNGIRTPEGVWNDMGLFTSGLKLYFLMCDGNSIQMYREMDKFGEPINSMNIIGEGSWRSRVGSNLWRWDNEIRIALYSKVFSFAEQQLLCISMTRTELIK
jgi:hypothetical protein